MTIRKAEKSDVKACVPLIYSAGVAVFDYLYAHAPMTSEQYIEQEFLSGRGYAGYPLHWVMEQDGVVVAAVACYRQSDLAQMDMGTTKNIIRLFKYRALKVVKRALHTGSVVTKPAKKGMHVANFGVDPAYQGQGIGTAMMMHLKALAQAEGCTMLSLDVSAENPRGQALYERIGFAVTQEKQFKGAHNAQVPNGRRMEWYF